MSQVRCQQPNVCVLMDLREEIRSIEVIFPEEDELLNQDLKKIKSNKKFFFIDYRIPISF